jgi:hypothetical protein
MRLEDLEIQNIEVTAIGEAFRIASDDAAGIRQHITADVRGLKIWLDGEVFNIPAANLPPGMVQALETAAVEELHNFLNY